MKLLHPFSLAFLTVIATGGQEPSSEPKPAALAVAHTQNTGAVPLYDVFEITFQHDRSYANPFFDVTIEVTFTSPSGKQSRVGGFHYGSLRGTAVNVQKTQTASGERRQVEYRFARQDAWKARFAPAEEGRWSYTYVFANTQGEKAAGQGSFNACGAGPSSRFRAPHPANPFRWVFDDGSAYFPIGLQECLGDNAGVGPCWPACRWKAPFARIGKAARRRRREPC